MTEKSLPDATEKATLPEILTILTTEHYNLQAGRAGTISESNGRASLFVVSVSSGLVALGFVGQVSKMDDLFFLFCIGLFPSLSFMGVATYLRLLQSDIEDTIYLRGINRIRHFYVETIPEYKDYFILSTHDDMMGMSRSMGLRPNAWQTILTIAGVVAVINSVLMGGFTGILLANLLRWPAGLCVGGSAVIFVISMVLHQVYQNSRWTEDGRMEEVMFPSPPGGDEAKIPANL